MSKGYRFIIIAAVGLALFTALMVGAFFGALNAPHNSYPNSLSADHTADIKQHNPSQTDRNRAGLPSIAERIVFSFDPKNEDERENRDLAAQESMSVWAFWMLVTSAAGVVTTAIGTGLLLWQIILTRQAVKDTGEATEAMLEANEIAQQAQRPWLNLNLGNPTQIQFQAGENPRIAILAPIKVTNFGNTPAARTFVEFEWVTGSYESDDKIIQIAERARTKRSSADPPVFPKDEARLREKTWLSAVVSDGEMDAIALQNFVAQAALFIVVCYRSSNGGFFYTGDAFNMKPTGQNGRFYYFDAYRRVGHSKMT